MIGNMSAVVVGADRLGNIPVLLKDHNIEIKQHISGAIHPIRRKPINCPPGRKWLFC